MPRAAVVHDNFTGPTGMGLVVGRHARWLLNAGWSVTLVGDNIPADLGAECQVVRVVPPRRLPSLPQHLAWCANVRRRLRGIKADIIHAHSPFLAADAHIITSHFMALPSYMRGAREIATGPRAGLRRVQGFLTRNLDHRSYHALCRQAHISFVSEFLRDEFVAWYGPPRGGWVFAPPAPDWRPASQAERGEAQASFGVSSHSLNVGYVGGSDPRKGYLHLAQLAPEPELTLLVAGPGSDSLSISGHRGLGFVDVDRFYAACDVVVAPAVFDSAPVAVLQAAARDIPIVTTAYSGWATAIKRSGAGVVWDGQSPLIESIRRARACTTTAARRQFLAEFSEERQRARLVAAYSEVSGIPPPG